LELTADEIDDYIRPAKAGRGRKATVNRVTECFSKPTARRRSKHFSESTFHPSLTWTKRATNGRVSQTRAFEKLLKHIPNDGLRDFVEWGYKTGQRKNETAAMTWAMFDSKDGVLRIPGDQCKNRIDRTSPLTAALRAIIERRQAKREIKTKDGSVRMTNLFFTAVMAGRIAILRRAGKPRVQRRK